MRMIRDVSRLADRFDVLVIGGGIYGAWIAYDAALRGLSVALVERDDWGAGTSSASSKLIHGGLRYLEHGALGLVTKSLRERARLLRLAPHRVWPLRFLLPLYSDSRAGPMTMTAGLWLYDRLAGHHPGVKPHRACATDEMLTHAPFLAGKNMRGGCVYSDAGSDDARFTLEIVSGAMCSGAVAVNHMQVDQVLRSADGTVVGAAVSDRLSGSTHVIQAQVTVNAAGPWAAALAGMPTSPCVRRTKGIHLVMPPLPVDEALLLTAQRDRRVFFLIPWYGATLLGTTDTDFTGIPGSERVEDADIDYLLEECRYRCPGLGWTRADVRGSFVGVRTLQGQQAQKGKSAGAVTREWQLAEPASRLFMPIGGKFTSARVEAAHTVDRIAELLHRRLANHVTANRPFPWSPPAPWNAWLTRAIHYGTYRGLDAGTAAVCARRYGSKLDQVHALITDDESLAERINPRYSFCWAEVIHAIDQEMACTVDDVLRRRIPLAILDTADAAVLARVQQMIDEQRVKNG